MSNCVHDNGEYCEMLSDNEVRQPCLETPLCEDYKGIVRCKDCKHCEDESYTDEDTGKEVKYLVCDRWYEQDDADGNMFPKADDFCSKGERKDD